MAIISVLVFYVSVIGILMFNQVHYSDIMNNAKEKMTSMMNKVEVSSDNIVDELTWHLSTPEQVFSTIEYELNTNQHLYGAGVSFIPNYYPQEGLLFEPYALRSKNGITLRDISSDTHDYTKAEWYLQGIESSKGVWSNPYFDPDGGGDILCTFSRQLLTPEGKVVGVFGIDMTLEELYTIVVDNFKKENEKSPIHSFIPKDSKYQIYSFIIAPDGTYIVHPDMNRTLITNFDNFATGKDSVQYRRLGAAMKAGKTGDMNVTVDGIHSVVYYAPLLNSGWSMGVVVPRNSMLIPGYIISSIIIILILLGLFIIFLICHTTIQRTTKPLIQLTKSTEEVARGEFNAILPEIKTNDEIRHLRDSFDNMQKSLSLYVKELTETTAQKASMENELDVARKIQMAMLPMKWPAFPERNDIDIYGSVTPAKAVGGDLYDIHIQNGKLYFCIGDVAGKGVPASLVMSTVISTFHTLSAFEDNPARIISSMSSSLAERNGNMIFVTFFAGVLDLSTGELLFSNAGHNAPMIISDGKAEMLKIDPNVPMGIEPDWKYSMQKMTLSPDMMLFLYTDGLTEATRNDGKMFEEERVLKHLSGVDDGISAQNIITHMLKAVNKFVGNAEQSDDLTMLALRLTKEHKKINQE